MKTYTRRKRVLDAHAGNVDSKRAAVKAPDRPLVSPAGAKHGADPYAFADELDADPLLVPGPGAPANASSPIASMQGPLPRTDVACERLPASSPPEAAQRAGQPGALPGGRAARASTDAPGLSGCTRRAAWELEAVREAAPRAQHNPEFLRTLVALHGSQGADEAEPDNGRAAHSNAAAAVPSRCNTARSLPCMRRHRLLCNVSPAERTNAPTRTLARLSPEKRCYVARCSGLDACLEDSPHDPL